MFNIGPQELLLILLVALVVVGPKRLPELSRTIGRGLREFRKAQDEVKKTINLSLDEREPTSPTRTRGTAPAASAAADERVDGASEADAEAQAGSADPTADVARTLGRGLAEIRRARREVQRTFRVDLTDEPPRRPSPSRTPPTTSAEAGTPPAVSPPAEAPRDPQDGAPAGPEMPA